MKISDNLRSLMDELKMTEAKLARSTGIPQPTLHRILSGATRSPRGDALSKLANFFSVTISQLFGEDPLPTNRLPGTHNPHVRTWQSIPLMTLDEVLAVSPLCEENLNGRNWTNWTTTDVQTTPLTFAINVNNDSLNPRFPNGTVLVVEPGLTPEDRDFLLISTKGARMATVKQLLLDGQDHYLKPLNPEFQTVMMSTDHHILGVVLQVRMDIRRRQAADIASMA